METREQKMDRAEAIARERGAKDGKNAAEWYAQDAFGGRVTRGAEESARRILKGMEDGDPQIMESLPRPNLSGEWADDMTGPQLVDECLSEAGLDDDDEARDDCFTDICDAYENAWQEACDAELHRLATLAAQPEGSR